MPKRIIYHTPSRQIIEEYVQKVCERLSEHDTSYLTPEVMSGLTRFLEVTGDILAKHLNEESETNDNSLANQNK